MLTASAEDTQYSGIGTTAVNGKLYALGAKGSYTDTSIPFTAGTKLNSDMKLYARWDENKGGTTSGLPFTDVSQNDWFYDAVKYVYSGKLFSGVSDTEFAPNSPLTIPTKTHTTLRLCAGRQAKILSKVFRTPSLHPTQISQESRLRQLCSDTQSSKTLSPTANRQKTLITSTRIKFPAGQPKQYHSASSSAL